MKQCTEKGDDKTKFDTTAINTYWTYTRSFRTRKFTKFKGNLKKIYYVLDKLNLSKAKIRHVVRLLSTKYWRKHIGTVFQDMSQPKFVKVNRLKE